MMLTRGWRPRPAGATVWRLMMPRWSGLVLSIQYRQQSR
jgi:hypothetical protein